MPLKKTHFTLVLQSEGVAIDVDDDEVVKDPIEHRDGEHAVAGEGAIPTAEGDGQSDASTALPFRQ